MGFGGGGRRTVSGTQPEDPSVVQARIDKQRKEDEKALQESRELIKKRTAEFRRKLNRAQDLLKVAALNAAPKPTPKPPPPTHNLKHINDQVFRFGATQRQKEGIQSTIVASKNSNAGTPGLVPNTGGGRTLI